MGLGSRLSPLKSRNFFIPSCHMQQLHATKARLSTFWTTKKKSQVLKSLKDFLKLLGNSPCHIPNQQPTTVTSLRPRRPNKGRSPATWGLCDPRNAECDDQRQAAQALDQRRVVSFLLAVCGCFAWSLLGQAYLVANPNSDWLWFQVDIVKTVVRLFYWSSHEVLMSTFWKSWSTVLHFLSYWPFLKWTDGPYGFRRSRCPPVTLVKVVDVDVGDEELESNCIIFAGSIWQDIQQEFRVAGFRYSMPRKEDWLSIGRSFAPQFSEWAGKFCDDCMSISFISFHSSAPLIQFVIAFPVAKSSHAYPCIPTSKFLQSKSRFAKKHLLRWRGWQIPAKGSPVSWDFALLQSSPFA